MLTEKRYEKIIDMLEEKSVITVKEVTHVLNSSDATTRRDFKALEKMGKIKRVHGGAIRVENSSFINVEEDIITKKNIHKEEKDSIGKMAAGLINENDFVYLDAGTSTEAMIKHIKVKHATFVTNGVYQALNLSKIGYKVYILSGETKALTGSVTGAEAVQSINKYNFTKGFFGTNGVDINAGYTTYEDKEAMVKESGLKKCKRAFVLSDSSKFNKIAPITFGNIEDATIITVGGVNSVFKEKTKIMEAE